MSHLHTRSSVLNQQMRCTTSPSCLAQVDVGARLEFELASLGGEILEGKQCDVTAHRTNSAVIKRCPTKVGLDSLRPTEVSDAGIRATASPSALVFAEPGGT